jgi:hypothetical protein
VWECRSILEQLNSCIWLLGILILAPFMKNPSQVYISGTTVYIWRTVYAGQ